LVHTRHAMADQPRARPRVVLEEKWIGQPPLRYGSFCIETYPCQHAVELNGVVQDGLWWGTRIVQWYRDNNTEVPEHFAYLLENGQRR